jgi:hypothetical protein
MRLALCIVALLASACTADTSNPFASFETRCAKLPPARYDVVPVPFEMQEVDGADVRELTQRSGASFSRHRTFGLTTVSFGHETQTEIRLLEERSSGRTCGVPHVTVQVSMQPVVVYVARELNDDACRHAATREHELQHVAVYRQMLGETVAKLNAELAPAMGTQVLQDSSGAILQRRYEARLREYLSRFMHARHEELAARQARIDSPEEYARVAAACTG